MHELIGNLYIHTLYSIYIYVATYTGHMQRDVHAYMRRYHEYTNINRMIPVKRQNICFYQSIGQGHYVPRSTPHPERVASEVEQVEDVHDLEVRVKPRVGAFKAAETSRNILPRPNRPPERPQR
jgi:hypothetical protein